MDLDWCKLIDTEAGWVSDNYLAFARIMKWYYFPLMHIVYKDSSKKITNFKPCDVEVIHDVVGGLREVIKCVMGRVVSITNTLHTMERYIKLFLSAVDRIDQSLKINNSGGKESSTTKIHISY